MSSLQDKPIFIVGASLTGYAVAATLGSLNFSNVTVIDSSPDPTCFDRSRAYSQCLYAKAQRLLAELPHFAEMIEEDALRTDKRRVTTCLPDGSTRFSESKLESGPVYWALKHNILRSFDKYIKKYCPQVKILTSTEFLDIIPPSAQDNHSTKVVLRSTDGKVSEHEVHLVLGCDGMHSHVLSTAIRLDEMISSRHGMAVEKRAIASTGIRAKGLLLTARPIISAPGAKEKRTQKDMVYRFVSETTDGKSCNLLLLPVGTNEETQRVGVMGVEAEHPVMKATSGEEVMELLRCMFPQLCVDDIVSLKEAEKFSQTVATTMPKVRWATSVGGTFGEGQSGVLLLGDAGHSFPPDLAQGVNVAFEEACTLREILVAQQDQSAAGGVRGLVEEFERRRGEETRALVKLAACGAAYQYGQNWFGLRAEKLNRRVRGGLARVLPWVFAPCADSLARSGMEYSRAARKVDATTRNLWVMAGVVVAVAVNGIKRASEDV